MADKIQTIEDLEKLYYSQAGSEFLRYDNIKNPFIQKDAPVISTTTGVYNAVYDAQAWVQLNMEANTFGVLPKVPWGRSGWRAITARSTTLGSAGIAETGSIPATVKPTFAEISTKPKLIARAFDNSEIQEFLATQSNDDAYGSMAQLRAYMANEFKEEVNVELNVQNGTLAGNNFDSMDRVFGSYPELNNCSENDQSTPYTANDLDIYGQDRDGGASFADAYVGHNSSVNRALTDSVLQGLLQNVLTNGANPAGQFIQTGYDTWSTINQIYDAQARYNMLGSAYIQPGINGVKTLEGRDVGMSVSTWLGRAIIPSKDTVQDASGISRIYMPDISNPEGYDLPRLSIKVAKPTQYFEAGINQGTPFSIDRFGNEGAYRMMGEIICTFFAVQGKLRDLTS